MTYSRIVSLDGSKLAEAALPHALMLTEAFEAELNLLVVIPPAEEVIEVGSDVVHIDNQWEVRRSPGAKLSQIDQQQAKVPQSSTAKESVMLGSAAEAIREYVEEGAIDLIVMTTHGRSGLRRWVFGSVADKVLRGARTTILLVRSAAESAGPVESAPRTEANNPKTVARWRKHPSPADLHCMC